MNSPRTGPIVGNAYILPWWHQGKPSWVMVCYVGSKDEYGNYGRESLSCGYIGDRLENSPERH